MKYKLKELIEKGANIRVNMQEQYAKIIDELNKFKVRWSSGSSLPLWDLREATHAKEVILYLGSNELSWGMLNEFMNCSEIRIVDFEMIDFEEGLKVLGLGNVGNEIIIEDKKTMTWQDLKKWVIDNVKKYEITNSRIILKNLSFSMNEISNDITIYSNNDIIAMERTCEQVRVIIEALTAENIDNSHQQA